LQIEISDERVSKSLIRRAQSSFGVLSYLIPVLLGQIFRQRLQV